MLYRLPQNQSTKICQRVRGPSGKRARMAAQWVSGALELKPTVRSAAAVFDVTPGAVVRALGRRQKPAKPALVRAWSAASEPERLAFVRMCTEEIWSAVDRVTA
jgi:hypothetical protein